MNKIYMLLRTRDEERNIRRFCEKHPSENVDKIIVSDGLSEDKTVEIAQTFSNTCFHPFFEIVYGDHGLFRQPEGKHLCFMSDWAIKEGATAEDWLVLDDCDSYPTEAMVRDYRKIFEEADNRGMLGIGAYHLYLWGKDQYFPKANVPGQILYAWKVKCGVFWDKKVEWGVIPYNQPSIEKRYSINNPYALIHDFAPTQEIADKKWRFYVDCGRMTDGQRPVYELFGPAVPLESWMK
jgi:hypothetical protein